MTSTKSIPLGIIRLERAFGRRECFWMDSSFVEWLNAFHTQVPRLALLFPLIPQKAEIGEGFRTFRLTANDVGLFVPDMKGYGRVLLNTPLLMLQLFRMRRHTSYVLCRAPEHGNWLILPLLRLLRFNYAVWLVHDRDEALKSEVNQRPKSLSLAIGWILNRLTGWIEFAALRRATVIANGSRLASKAKAGGVASDRILAIVSSTLSARDIAIQRPKTLSSGEQIKLLYVGRIAAEKGLGDLVEAVRILSTSSTPRRSIHVTIVGWEAQGEGERIRNVIRDTKLDSQFEFVGRAKFGPQLFQRFSDADVFVLPSHAEGTPRVLVEAMAFGLPIVATNVGGIPDVMRDQVNGYLVCPRSPNDIADRIDRLITDPTRYVEISKNNIETARDLLVEGVSERIAAFLRYHGYPI